jgi:hypothetical protein
MADCTLGVDERIVRVCTAGSVQTCIQKDTRTNSSLHRIPLSDLKFDNSKTPASHSYFKLIYVLHYVVVMFVNKP